MNPRLIIFDCDGVLVDSEPISMSVLLGVITGAGGAVSEEAAYLHFLGRSMASVRAVLLSDFGFTVTEDHLLIARREMRRRFTEELQPMPGMADALRRLDMPCCVASSGTLERIRLSLATTGLLELLEPNLYSATMVERGKPAPDLFLHAARDMGAPPAACIVVEDSPAGVEAAKAAGMRVFGFTGGSHAGKAGLAAALAALGPDLVFDDMARLPELVARSGSQARAG
ncbi:HAD family hydrolase [Mesorhizobium sp. ASY16-5R]|uniref:HAD family hydrolase n=1 Tax=Mesorhizobium sp. ASY16-5R TaxID=3445772 RepID=UPI003F9F26B0